MTSTTFFIIFIPILAILLLSINLILAPHNPYQEKDSVFECGFHSFLGQNRTQFSISFFIFGLLFLLFDLEILLVYPYSVSSYTNDIYGLVIMMVFFVLLTLGFIFELGKNALTIDSRQTSSYDNKDTARPVGHISTLLESSIVDLVNLLHDIVEHIPSGEQIYENIKQQVTNSEEIPSGIDKWYEEQVKRVQEISDAVRDADTTGETQENIERAKNSAEILEEAGKKELSEGQSTAKEMYEDRK